MTTLTRIEQLPPVTQGVFEDLGYEPTDGQLPIILNRKRFTLVTGGIQSGKTELYANLFHDDLNLDIARWQPCVIEGRIPSLCPGHKDTPGFAHLINGRCDPSLMYWLVGREYIMCEEEYNRIYQGFIVLGFEPGKNLFRASRVDAPGWIHVKFPDENSPRIRIDVKSEARPDAAFSRVSPHAIGACEAGQLGYSTFQHLNSRTIGRNARLYLVGTIEKAQPWFPAMSEAWAIGDSTKKSFALPTWSNNFLFPGGENDPEILRMKAENPDDFYMERIAGKAVPPEGLVFKEFNLDVHVDASVKHIPGETVYIWIDPGYQRGSSAHAAYLAQKIEGQYRVFDELHEYETLTEDVIHWWQQHPAHTSDARLSIDPFYKDVHHAMGSVAELWMKETGLVTSSDNKRVDVRHADTRLSQYLHVNPLTKRPGIVFSPKCQGIISEFGAIPSPHSPHGEVLAYRWKTGDSGQNIGARPVSEHCDGIRAVEAGIVDNEGMSYSQGNRQVTRRGGQPASIRRRGKPHERLPGRRR